MEKTGKNKMKISIKPFKKAYLSEVISMSRRSDSTSRTPETWRGNNMTAVLAFNGPTLVGMIPIERRKLVTSDNKTENVLWVSGAHVDADLRGMGLGSRLDAGIRRFFSKSFKGVFVYRHDKKSKAYRWYIKNGYRKIVSIVSLKRKTPASIKNVKYTVLSKPSEFGKWGQKLSDLLTNSLSGRSGFAKRYPCFWKDKASSHYYKNFYSYSIIILPDSGRVSAYALCGLTSMKDGIRRIDILEYAQSGRKNLNRLYAAICDLAGRKKAKEIRVQLSARDRKDLTFFFDKGFKERWKTNVLFKGFGIGRNKLRRWKYFQFDYI